MTVAPARVRAHPVVEVFGPTIQGEGWLAGAPTYFVRLGGCDWRCAWCDSMHAVEPARVREAPKLTAGQIVNRLARPRRADWVTLSGGNPALHELGDLVALLHEHAFAVAVETQGSRWRDWLGRVDHLTVSPKPPSSGEASPANTEAVCAFMSALRMTDASASLKIVVFDRADLDYAFRVAGWFPWLPLYLSCGTDAQGGEGLDATARRYQWLCEAVAGDGSAVARRARVLPQLHVVAWGHRLGV